MHRILILIFAASMASAPPLAAQSTPKNLFARLQAREQIARRSLDAGRPADVVRKSVLHVVAGYEGFVGRFPRSGYSDNALWQAAMLAASSFARYHVESDRIEAVRLLRRLGTQYPSSSLMRQAKAATARLSGSTEPLSTRRNTTSSGTLERAVASAPAAAAAVLPPAPPPPALVSVAMPPVAPARPVPTTDHAVGTLAQLRAVRRTVLPDVVRVAIELDREVDFHNDRITGPDRVFVDLQGTEIGSTVQSSATWDDGIVRAVRVGPRAGNATRVVLDLSAAGHYSVFTLYNPFRVVVDLDREGQAGVPAVLKASTSPSSDNVLRAALGTAVHPPPDAVAASPSAAPSVPERVVVPAEETVKPAPQVDSVAPGATVLPGPAPNAVDVTPAPIPARHAPADTAAANAPTTLIPESPAQNLQGRFSLSRQLGLGISRIVIDPGHGGHDPGAQSRGLNEADLVLDVALRLQQLLARTPGVEVVLTRNTNVFVPLEERTAIANRGSADLFLSIHANASRNPKARGIETYFLNFASNPDAEAVAARENSASGQAMHDLPDIVKAITLNNKLDESRDFATLVQRSMIDHLGSSNKSIRDLGVRQAPFVVLIGAGMPSILAEISFLTHTQEGHLLKTNAYRQKIAEALYQGLQEYQRSLKVVKTVAASK
jgi:N-acetylmuramoyl-L-alanine amidase